MLHVHCMEVVAVYNCSVVAVYNCSVLSSLGKSAGKEDFTNQ